jgi:hypothetical protein
VLSAREQTVSVSDSAFGLSTSYRWRNIQVQGTTIDSANALKLSTTGIALASQLIVSVQSGGFNSGNFSKVEIVRDGNLATLPAIFGRGLNVVILDPLDGAIVEAASFDTHISPEESEELAKLIEWLEPGMLVVIVAKVIERHIVGDTYGAN